MSSYSDPMKLFSVLKQRAQTQSSGGGSSFGNPNILKLKENNSYSLRLLWIPSETREHPMINQYVHRIWDDNAVGSKDVHVICPTSQYDHDSNGFKLCPICEKMSSLYKTFQETGSSSAEELYKKFKRTLRGYVPVYVVNGPAEDIHQVKILQYSIMFKKYFDEKIFGIKPIKKNGDDSSNGADVDFDESNCVGLNAFMYFDPKTNSVVTKGHNFIINVGTKKIPINGKITALPDYKLDFSMKETDISDFNGTEITPEYFNNLSKELHFDEDFFKPSNVDELNRFKMKYIDGVDVEEVSTESVQEEEEEEIPMPKAVKKSAPAPTKEVVEEEEEPVVAKPAKKPVKKQVIEEEVEEDSEDSSTEKSSDDEDFDLDSLLADIN